MAGSPCDTRRVTTPVTSELVARTGAALERGGWRYTPRQLYYATCAASETGPPSARTEFALGVLLGLVALILLPWRPAALAVGILAVLALALGAFARLRRRPPGGRVLAVSFAEFAALLPDTSPLPGLIDVGGATGIGSGTAASATVVVVCDTAESAAALQENFAAAGLDPVPVLTLDQPNLTTTTAIALHDASPRGCALPLELVDAGARVIDAGLRPAWVDGGDVQVLEGAPARMPRDLASVLSDDELDWLRSGRRVELAVLPPQQLMRLLRAAIERAAALPDAAAATAAVEAVLPSLPAG